MTKRNYTQFTCDYCGNATDYPCYRLDIYDHGDHYLMSM